MVTIAFMLTLLRFALNEKLKYAMISLNNKEVFV